MSLNIKLTVPDQSPAHPHPAETTPELSNDEILVVTVTHDFGVRLTSYRLLSKWLRC